jgi:hypothetical protein
VSSIHRCTLYGLRLEANVPLPGLDVPLQSDKTDLRLHLKEAGDPLPFAEPAAGENVYTSENRDSRGQPVVRVARFADGAYFGFFYCDGVRYIVRRDAREIWGDWPDEDYTLEDAARYLMGPVMGLVLRLRGVLPLHASAIAVGDAVIALAGAQEMGKSTAAAGFARLGYAVVSDDLATVQEEGGAFLVQPGYPRVNLWPDSARNLFGAEESLALISPTWEKRYLALDQNGFRFERRRLPLGVIYVLGNREEKLQTPVIEDIEGSSALLNLVANTYVNYLIDAEMRQREFAILGRLLTRVPVRLVHPPADPARMLDLCEAIRDDAVKFIHAQRVSARQRNF